MIRILLFLVIGAAAVAPLAARPTSDDAEVRAVMQRSFQLLKDGQYAALYDALPAAARKNMTRERFVQSMQRSRGLYRLDRLEMGAVHVNGNVATIDTTMYGRVLKPQENEGKIVVRQRFVREGGSWHLAVSPAAPRVFVLRDGRWVDITNLLRQAGQRRG